MRAAELRNRQNRAVTPFVASSSVVDFRPRTVRAAAPLVDADLATKLYADTVSGSNAQRLRKPRATSRSPPPPRPRPRRPRPRDRRPLAATYAAILGNPDYGFYTDIPTTSRDYGTYV
jgi:hypothetical protein